MASGSELHTVHSELVMKHYDVGFGDMISNVCLINIVLYSDRFLGLLGHNS